MTKTLSAADAKASFADALRTAEAGESVVITRYGQPVAVLVSPQLAADLERLQAAGPEAGLAGLLGRYDDGDELEAALEAAASAPRPLPEFE